MRDIFYAFLVSVYLMLLFGQAVLINAGLRACKYLIGLTGWRVAINTYKSLHVCGEKLSRHIRRVIPE